jgi:branched-chain amino acid transport system substrate-binding protein
VAELPSGTVTFLFTDIEGSTRLLKQLRDRYGELLAEHQRLLRSAFEEADGHEIDTQGDSFFVAFRRAKDAVAAAATAQRSLAAHDWPEGTHVRVRMGIHTGEPAVGKERYVGLGVHRAARIMAAGHGGQVLISRSTRAVLEDDELDGIGLRDLGERRLKDLDRPEHLYQLEIAGLDNDFPPLKTLESQPEQATPFEGREAELAEAAGASLVRRPLSTRNWAFVGLVAAVLVGGITAAVVALNQSSGNAPTSTSSILPDSLAVVDPKTSGIVGQVRIPGGPSLVAAGGSSVWVASNASRTVSSISADKPAVSHVVAPNVTPSALAADGDAVWALDGNRRMLVKIDPTYGAVTKRIKLPRAPPSPATNRRLSSLSVRADAGVLWVTDGSTRLLRIDPKSGRVLNALDVHEPLDDVAVGDGAVWAISGRAASLFRIDLKGQAVRTRIRVVNRLGSTAPFPVAVAAGEGSIWVVNGNSQTVSRVDPEFGGVTATISLGIGSNPSDIAAGAGAIWVANSGSGTLARIDPTTNRVALIPLGSSPAGVAVGGGQVWVSVQPGFRTGVALPSNPSARSGGQPQALPASSCSPIEFSGKGRPQLLIASDLPLQGQTNLAETLQQGDAIRFVLARRNFKAGAYSVGYQSCDNSSSQTGSYDVGRCKANAKAFAADESVVAIVGGYNSGCVQAQLAILAGAHPGPLAMISGNATYVGLTHSGPGTTSGEPGRYRPQGRRSFVRVVTADDLQGAADALLAKRLGATKLFALHDGDPYGFGIAANVRHAATKLGISTVGFVQWDPHARTYIAVARKVKRSGADAVFIGSSLDVANAGVLVKNLRSVLGDRVAILTPDGFMPFDAFVRLVGPSAEGVTVSFPATPPERLHGEGRRFVAQFGKAVGRPIEAYSVAWAQATEVLLDAIARSDGTRASVTANLFKTKVKNGILGSFTFDRNGDTTAGSVTIYKVIQGKPAVFAVITPPARLVH